MTPIRHRLADFLDRFDFGVRQAQPLELVGAGFNDRVVMKRIEGRKQPVAYSGGTRHRQLLAADDRAQAGIAAVAPAQVKGAGFFRHRHQPRIGGHQFGEPGLQIVLAMEEMGHVGFHGTQHNRLSSSAKADDPYSWAL